MWGKSGDLQRVRICGPGMVSCRGGASDAARMERHKEGKVTNRLRGTRVMLLLIIFMTID